MDNNKRSGHADTIQEEERYNSLDSTSLLCAGLIAESVNEESFMQIEELLSMTHSGNIRYLSEPKAAPLPGTFRASLDGNWRPL
jgi:hypothetical protein